MIRDLWKALAQLYPEARPFVDYQLEAVGEGPARITQWHLPGGPPTEAEMDAAIQAYDAAAAQRQTDASVLRQKLLTTAQGAVGQPIDTLTAGQVRALVACLLYKAGALDKAGVVRPLSEWP